jgi:O-antigen ligase
MDSDSYTIGLSPLVKEYKFVVVGLFVSQVILVYLLCFGHLNLFSLLAGTLVFFFAITDFELSVYLLISSFFIEYFFFPGWGIKLADFSSLAVVLAYLGKQAFSGQFLIRRTPLDKSILLFVLALTISLVNIADVFTGARNYFRHVQMFILFYVLASGIKKESILKLLKFFLILATLHSFQTLFLFITTHGERTFGIAGVPFANIVVVALTICYVFYLFQEQHTQRLKYGFIFVILLGALIATQTRSAVLSFLLGYVVVSILAYRKSKIENLRYVRNNLLKLALIVVLFSIVVISLQPAIISRFAHQMYTLSYGPVGTIKLRFVLWDMALKAFFHSPLFGVGIGQFTKMRAILPEVRFIPLYEHVSGLSAHNLFFSFLAETGLIGILCLFYFIFSFLKLGWLKYKSTFDKGELPICLSILGGMIAGQWAFWSVPGILFMLFLALLVVFNRSKRNENELWKR